MGWEGLYKNVQIATVRRISFIGCEVQSELVFEPDYETEIEHVVVKGGEESSFFYSIDYVKGKMQKCRLFQFACCNLKSI